MRTSALNESAMIDSDQLQNNPEEDIIRIFHNVLLVVRAPTCIHIQVPPGPYAKRFLDFLVSKMQ